MAGIQSERQEQNVIRAIRSSIYQNRRNPITVLTNHSEIEGVVNAKKYAGRQISGSEPYTDVQLVLYTKRIINLSLKGMIARSIAGGGITGIETILPGVAKQFSEKVFNYLISKNYNVGDKIPLIYSSIPSQYKPPIVIGNKQIGGPIDYMFIGPMDIRYVYDKNSNKLQFQRSSLIPANEFAARPLYFRLRPRHADQRFDPSIIKNGIHRIYGRSPTKNEFGGRIDVLDRILDRDSVVI